MIDLYKYLPNIIREIAEFQQITNSEQREIDEINEQTEMALNNQFIETAEDYGLNRWEKILKLSIIPESSIENRRKRIFAFIRDKQPYSMESLGELLTELCGENNFTITETGAYAIAIVLTALDYCNSSDINRLLKYIIPCNISYTITYPA